MKPAIQTIKVSKKYKALGWKRQHHTFMDTVNGFFSFGENKTPYLWALQEVSFDLMPGESIGVMGRNGAGKSTLLRVLSRVTPPTTGRILVRGRVNSLLEVGTSFHNELTGRENILLNGAILGLKHQEVKNRLDEIVDFSGIEAHLNMPLKTYSTGMALRLAFSVSVHFYPDILLIDEVLAVGDLEFQQKCLNKLNLLKAEGKAVLFVSHNIEAINLFCDKGLVLQNGAVHFEGNISEALLSYEALMNTQLNLSNKLML